MAKGYSGHQKYNSEEKKRQTKKKIYFYKTYIILGRETINKIKYIV